MSRDRSDAETAQQTVIIPPDAYGDRVRYTSGHIGLVVETEDQRRELREAVKDV